MTSASEIGSASGTAASGGSAKPFSLKDAAANARFTGEAQAVNDRLMTASISESMFWDHLIDELLSSGNDAPLTAQVCEVALLRAGHSQFQSDQTAAAIHRSIEHCRRLMTTDAPRWTDQLRLRYAPLKQAYESYGPGLVRSIGHQVWNGSPPKNWWPGRVTVHAVQPLGNGAAGRSDFQSCVWIEAVLTDISPNVPEWLRLVYQLTLLAIDTQTRTHASTGLTGSGASSGSSSGSSSSNPGGQSGSGAKPGVELPWSIGIIPLILDQAAETGVVPPGQLSVAEAFDMWWSPEDMSHDLIKKMLRQSSVDSTSESVALSIERWWHDCGKTATAFPIALKQLAVVLSGEQGAKN